jgi:exosortase E/protease (VPEID-CTERM system)
MGGVSRFGLLLRVGVLTALLCAEKVLLTRLVDVEHARSAVGFGALLHDAQHWGFRLLVAFLAAFAVFGWVARPAGLPLVDRAARAVPMRWSWWLLHAVLLVALGFLSHLLYRYTPTELSLLIAALLWVVIACAVVLTAGLALLPARLWRDAARAMGSLWYHAFAASLVGTLIAHWLQSFWSGMATLTFELVRWSLGWFIPSLTAEPAERVLRTQHFAVQIGEVCSGLEGMGLMLAFTVAWLTYFRRDYRFPQALWLIPAGLVAIYALNVLRIAALVSIGEAGYPEVAVYGFHSQAGWIAFNLAACAWVIASRTSRTLYRGDLAPRQAGLAATGGAPVGDASHAASSNPTAAYLMPLIMLLAAGLVSRAASGRFETFYALRLLALAPILWIFRREYRSIDWRAGVRGLSAGGIVFLVWVGWAWLVRPVQQPMPPGLALLSQPAQIFWIATRLLGTVIAAPFAEELAYRGFLMRRLTAPQFETVPFQAVRWPALVATALVFGLTHGAFWLPGVIAGVLFGVVARRGLGQAVLAHAVCNALLAVGVLGWGQWQWW